MLAACPGLATCSRRSWRRSRAGRSTRRRSTPRVQEAVTEVVGRQGDRGIDVVNDGEMARRASSPTSPSASAASSRAPEPRAARGPAPRGRRLPRVLRGGRRAARTRRRRARAAPAPSPTRATTRVQADIANLKAAMAGAPARRRSCRPSRRPTSRAASANEYYKTDEEYLFAIAEAMREEYRAIVDAGFLLQIDDPRLVTYYVDCSPTERRRVPRVGRAARGGAQPRAARHSRRSGCASTPATASTWGRASTTWS